MKPVPMDPDKMTAGISFVNVGQNAIVSVELDFLDSSNISAVRDNPEKGIKIDMELGPGKTEDHLVLFNVSKLLPLVSHRSPKDPYKFPKGLQMFANVWYLTTSDSLCYTRCCNNSLISDFLYCCKPIPELAFT